MNAALRNKEAAVDYLLSINVDVNQQESVVMCTCPFMTPNHRYRVPTLNRTDGLPCIGPVPTIR
jgi:Iap family predicted aminopeptidase